MAKAGWPFSRIDDTDTLAHTVVPSGRSSRTSRVWLRPLSVMSASRRRPVRRVLRVDELIEPRDQHLLARAAHHLAEPVVGEGEAALEVDLGDAGDGAVDDRAEALLAIAQRALALRALEAGVQERVGHGVDLRHR